ncbi:MAG: hypothetical protein LBD59_02570 [Prevotellaceae bacterium]|jgi:hypothetical protein|nr:hypothetical protein [Prevotellaceae bacterium]
MLNNELKKNPFVTPGSYFDRLPSIIQDKSIEHKKRPQFGLVPKLAFAGGGFMTLALTLFLAFLYNSTPESVPSSGPKVIVSDEIKSRMEEIRKKGLIDAKVNYLAVRNVNQNDILMAKSRNKE